VGVELLLFDFISLQILTQLQKVLIESAERLPGANIFEQGFGKLNLIGAYLLFLPTSPPSNRIIT
jgi:hypothetical protein